MPGIAYSILSVRLFVLYGPAAQEQNVAPLS